MAEEEHSIESDAEERMKKTISVLESEFAKVRTGRATTGLVDGLRVDYYGAPTPLNQVANISIPDPQTILIQPWDENMITEIEKAIQQSDLGINPMNDGKVIRLSIPPLTEERRKEIVKYVAKIAEEHRVAIRQIRKDTNNKIKEVEKRDNLSEDEVKKSLNEVQTFTDKYISKINETLEKKEKDILEI